MSLNIESILLRDYEVMRAEVRMYISKFYIALSVIYGVLTAGIFQIGLSATHLASVLIPFVTMGLIGFMVMVTFFVNKTAGYIRLIEFRIARIHGCEPPIIGVQTKAAGHLAPILWEILYADFQMGRDTGKRMKNLYSLALLWMGAPAGIILIPIIIDGYKVIVSYLEKSPISIFSYSLIPEAWAWIYVCVSIAVIFTSGFIFYWVNKGVRESTQDLNNKILQTYPKEQLKNHSKKEEEKVKTHEDDDEEDPLKNE